MSSPKLTDLPLWKRFEERALRVLRHALTLLPETEPNLDEPRLNRLLFDSIIEANWLINNEDEGGLGSMPSYDGYQAPENVAAPPEEFERKRPDFSWSLHDHTAPSGREGCREFVIECKRLGNAPGGTNFNHRYVDHGVVRFVSATHKYGLKGTSGAMVGYVQRSNNPAILAVVRQRSATHNLAEIAVCDGMDEPVAELRQQLDRPFGASPFELIHLWVNLCPPRGAVAGPQYG